MKKIILIITAISVTITGFSQNAGKIVVSKGDKYVVKTNIKTHTITNAMGQDIEGNITADAVYQVTIDNASADTYQLTGSITNMKSHVSMMGQELDYDSDDTDASGPVADQMSQVLNKPQTIKIDNQGNIIESVDATDAQSDILNQLGNSNLSGSRATFFVVPGNIKPGDSFDITQYDTTLGATTNLKYTLKSILGDIANLSFTGTVNTNTVVQQMGMELNTKMAGVTTGELTVNIKTGVIQSSKTSNTSSGTASVMGQDLPVSVNVEATSVVSKEK